MDFLDQTRSLRRHYSLQNDYRFVETCNYLKSNLNAIVTSITGRFESFDRHSQNFWDDIGPDTFRKMKELVISHHTTVGGVLCGLCVKIASWIAKFPKNDGSRVQSRSDYIMGEMRQGISKIVDIENSAPSAIGETPKKRVG